jgi:hypothetical protein
VIRLTGLPGVTTNNQAEYVALISALFDLRGRIRRAGKTPSGYSLLLHTDSQLIVGQLTQGWKIKAANLRPLVGEAAAFSQALDRFDPSHALRTGLAKVLRTCERANAQTFRCTQSSHQNVDKTEHLCYNRGRETSLAVDCPIHRAPAATQQAKTTGY